MNILGGGTSSSNPEGIPDNDLLKNQNQDALDQRTILGIYTNSLNVSLALIDYNGLWQYNTESGKPSLRPPVVGTLRLDQSSETIDESWKGAFDKLKEDLQKLREEVLLSFNHNSGLPIEEKNPTLAALGKVLELTAKGLTWAENTEKILESAGPESEIVTRQTSNISLTEKGINGIADNSTLLFDQLKNQILSLGPNTSNFDELSGLANELGSAYQALLGK